MSMYQDSIAAATAVAGYDLFTGKEFTKPVGWNRIKTFAIVGSQAIADFECEIWSGRYLLGRFKNTATGAAVVPTDNDRKYLNKWFTGDLRCQVTDAAAANPVVYEIVIEKSKRRAWSGGRTRQTFRYGGTRRYATRY